MPRLLSRFACRDSRLVLALAALALLELAALALLALAAPARAANPNLAPNPGFEQPCPGVSCGWLGRGGLTVSSTDTARSGARAALIQGSAESTLVAVDCVPMAPSTTYAFSVWARPAGATPADVGLALADPCPFPVDAQIVHTSVPAGRWTRLSVTFTTVGGATGAGLYVLGATADGVIVDDAVFGVAAAPSIEASAFRGVGVEGPQYTPGTWTASAVTLHYTCAPGLDGLGVDCPAEGVRGFLWIA